MAAPDELDPTTRKPPTEAEPPARRLLPASDGKDDDVEGHLYGAGPSTQGEALPRIPDSNPHGDR